MRISDWSSDVCSSYLRFIQGVQINRAIGTDVGDGNRCVDTGGPTVTGTKLVQGVLGLEYDNNGLGQNGRASCRERVCQYVSFSLVAVSLTKKPYSYVSLISGT